MDLLEVGDWGYQIGGVGFLIFTTAFLVGVRWRSDLLGRLMAASFAIVSAIFLTGGYRLMHPGDSHGFLLWRMLLYVSFATVMWGSLGTFIWSQFFAPRIKNRTTRKRKRDEESSLARSRVDPDGNPYDRSVGNG